MRVGRIASGFLISVIAAGATAGVQHYDRSRSERHLIDFGIRTARQIAAQAEGLALNAKTRAETDPLSWAVGFLAQGVEPRTVQISKYRGPVGVVSEAYLLSQEGWFEYSKVSQPENGAGVKVRLWIGYRGFLDSRSAFANDVSIGFFFLLLWFALHGVLGLSRLFLTKEDAHAVAAPLSSIHLQLDSWALRGESVLVQLGTRVLDLLRETSKLRSIVLKSIEERRTSRRNIHAQIQRVREARNALKLSKKAFQVLEDALVDPARMPDPAKLHSWLSATKSLNLRVDGSLRELEIELEPIATDLDIASHADDDTLRIANELNQRIESAKLALKDQALLVREIRQTQKPDPGKSEAA